MAQEVTLLKSVYDEMMDRLAWLDALEAAGVDNWEGMDAAADIYNEGNEGEDE